MANFLLVHGGFHGGWCWDAVVPLLEKAGHTALAPDLPAMGSNTAISPAEVTLALWGDAIAQIAIAAPEPVILVGHSRGGIVISEAAERAPEAVAGLVYCSAMLLEDGDSLMVASSRLMPHFSPHVIVSEDGASINIDTGVVQEIFYNRTGQDVARRAIARLTPEPIRPNTTPIHITAERFGSIPRSFIECSEDNAIPLTVQRAMQAALLCNPVMLLESDHSPFFSAPEALTEALVRIANIWGR